ncbi:hypothetical protein [Falsirhodobacter halotolerans]|uniref:hypothetical protein n=1 Tax=Falsirhodobacter halotolerans TaxID=1146892 RepID=UPI001FD316B1|nr:hypothetical protein [Falsirhodobacter halotolerans]MCJ8140712.1 hypothetical protein [Falsirhodobacter halotolerans]
MSIWISNLLALMLLTPVAQAAGVALIPPAGFCMGAEDTGPIRYDPCAGADVPPAILTARIGAEGSAGAMHDIRETVAWISSDAGKAAMASRGLAADVQILELSSRGDALVMLLRDRALPKPFWRVLVPLRGRLVTLDVTGEDAMPIAAGRALAEAFLGQARKSNG